MKRFFIFAALLLASVAFANSTEEQCNKIYNESVRACRDDNYNDCITEMRFRCSDLHGSWAWETCLEDGLLMCQESVESCINEAQHAHTLCLP